MACENSCFFALLKHVVIHYKVYGECICSAMRCGAFWYMQAACFMLMKMRGKAFFPLASNENGDTQHIRRALIDS